MGCFDPKKLAPQGFGSISVADINTAVTGGTVEFTQYEQNLSVVSNLCSGEPTWRSRFNNSGSNTDGPNQTFITIDTPCDDLYTQYWIFLEPGWTWGTANPYAGKFAMRILGSQAWSSTAQLDAQAAAGTNGSAGLGWSSFAGQTPTTNPAGPAAITTYDYHQAYNAPAGEQFGDYGTGSADLVIGLGRWVCIEQRAKLNTPGVNDGLHEVRVNGVTVISDQRRWRAAGQNWLWSRISTNHSMGGPAGGTWAPQNPPQYQQYSAMRWSCNGWIGCCPEFSFQAESKIAAALQSCQPTTISDLVCRGSLSDTLVTASGSTSAVVSGEDLIVSGGTGTVSLSTSCECSESVSVTGSTTCIENCCLLPNAEALLQQALNCGTATIPAAALVSCGDLTALNISTTGGVSHSIFGSNLSITYSGPGSITVTDNCTDDPDPDPNLRTHLVDFTTAGVEGGIDTTGWTVRNVTGLTPAGQAANTTTLNQQIAAAPQNTILRMPPGTFQFNGIVQIRRDNLVLQDNAGPGVPGGLNSTTTMLWDSTSNTTSVAVGINIAGQGGPTGSDPNNPVSAGTGYVLTSNVSQGDTTFTVTPAPPTNVEFGIVINQTSNTNTGLGTDVLQEMFEVVSVSGNTVTVKEPMITSPTTGAWRVWFYNPGRVRQNAGIEGLTLGLVSVPNDRVATMVMIRDAVNCWNRNTESQFIQRAHTATQRALHCSVLGCFFNNATNHNDGGQGYGGSLGNGTTRVLMEDCEAYGLRHSFLWQGNVGNVMGFNHSYRPIHSTFQPGGPSDVSYHHPNQGWNLLEGNVVERIHVGDSGTITGGDQYIVRNVAYGAPMTVQQISSPVHAWCNVMTSTDAELQNRLMPIIPAEVSSQGSYAQVPARWYVSNGPGQPQGTSTFFANSDHGIYQVPNSPGASTVVDSIGNWDESDGLEAGGEECPVSCYGSSFAPLGDSRTGNWLVDGDIPAVRRMQARGL